jgi:transposase
MLKVDEYARIRLAHRDGMSIRKIARTYGHSRHTVRKVLDESIPKPYTLRRPRPGRKLGDDLRRVIDDILKSDESAPKKQRHTAQRICDRLKAEHGYSGGYDAVRRYVKSRRNSPKETFLPISLDAGQRVECDFGEIAVDFPNGRRTVSVLLVTWAYSGSLFAIALPSERVESILHGTVEAFEFFGCVPRELWWDNPRTVATTILRGRHRELNVHYQALASHYNFEPMFCMPARGNEKPHVEGRVKWLKHNLATPVPQVQDLDELNTYLRRKCQEDRSRTVSGKTGTIGERFEVEKQAAFSLPRRRFDACLSQSRQVDKYQSVALDGNRYSVPREFAFRTVTVKAYVNAVEVICEGRSVATHERSYDSGEMLLDPLHYLTILDRKPAYLEHTDVYKNWRLPSEFQALRENLEQRHGKSTGARQFIQVLQLLSAHPQQRILDAILWCQREGVCTAQRIIYRCDEIAQRQLSTTTDRQTLPAVDRNLPQVTVPMPDLSRFDTLLSIEPEQHTAPEACRLGDQAEQLNHTTDRLPFPVSQSSTTQGGVIHGTCEETPKERERTSTTEVQSQTFAPAHDAGRAPEASQRSCRQQPRLLGLPLATDRTGTGYPFIQCHASSNQDCRIPSSQGSGYV